jgi:hypothetical protein
VLPRVAPYCSEVGSAGQIKASSNLPSAPVSPGRSYAVSGGSILAVTTMFNRFFGVPQAVIRSGTWPEMKPTEQSLYICLLHESERCSTRELLRTDAQMGKLTKLSSRSFCNARKKLKERGLLLYRRGAGNTYIYTLCNPETSQPWPGDPKRHVPYIKKGDRNTPSRGGYAGENSTSAKSNPEPEAEVLGVPLKF